MRLINAKFQDALPKLDKFKMIFADPPDNIGLGYGECDDAMSSQDYWGLLSDIFRLSENKCDVLWLSFNARHLMGLSLLANSFLRGGWTLKPCVQTFTFGQHNQHDLGNNHRPLWRFTRDGCVTLYPDAVRVPSWRQLHGDKRADPRGRVPGDVFDFPRVTGNSKQRRKWHPTQLHEGLYERCIRLTCAPGDSTCDLFAGTGTLARACAKTGNPCTLIEMDRAYCEEIAAEHELQYVAREPLHMWTD